MFGEVGNKAFACQNARLGKAVDTLVNAGKHVAIPGYGGEVIALLDGLWDVFQGYSHEFRGGHGCAKVKILNVNCHPLCMF